MPTPNLVHEHRNHPNVAPDDQRFTCAGKQVFFDGEHFADARDEVAAMAIVDAFEVLGIAAGELPDEVADFLDEFLS